MPVYKEKNSKCTKDGRMWQFRCYYLDVYGNKKQKESKLYKTKKEAKDAEIEFLANVDSSTKEIDSSVKFERVFFEWLEFKKHVIKSSTFYGIKHRTEKHILEYFGVYKLHSIKINVINNWLNYMKEKKLSLQYTNTIISYLKEIMIYAKDNYDFDNKVVCKIHKYKIEVTEKKSDSSWNYWTNNEFNTFIEKVDNKFYYTVFYFMYYTGLRPGEFIALKWHNIDLKEKKLSINRTFTNKIENQIYSLTDPKTKNSIRTIDLDDGLVELMKKHYEYEKQLYNFSEDMFIFGNISYLPPTTLARNLDKYIKKAQVKRITPHGFRHSHVSLLIDLGADSRDVAERLGDTVRVIEETYCHMFPNKKSHTVNILNNFNKQNSSKIRGK